MQVLWCSEAVLVLIGAAAVDFVVGDPWEWIHPVQIIGWTIQGYQRVIFRFIQLPLLQKVFGIGLGLGLPLLSGAIAISIVTLANHLNPVLGHGTAIVILASCFAERSLRKAAEDVLHPLENGDIQQAQARLSLYVGRDTEGLSEAAILRAVLETISENTTDGVVAPLFYAVVGLAIGPAAGVGLAMAYKALSTLDSMIGYHSAPYTYLGWFSARSEDVATWLPCRLTVLTVALLSRHPSYVWRICCRDAPADPSPNAGWSECAYASALGVRLGGVNTYQGKPKEKPLLADPKRPISPLVIRQGLNLTQWTFLIWVLFGIIGLTIRDRLHL
ncbi:adenosylcobinamide-phosphate synthase CbiB [Oscillatoria sp. CS-180]|uniref:adenosylcobinamide-phosphate synthase CbiB n=1 Tax=Oscillatoria sp. CS-180 TaxID=3021720 RepID=UPI00232D58AF|nr:adenosylcobinamide-phosphate synthase CbiB [Oscillatoria sp. CS-180]MDB9525905.1 adenosylcobinamide-phosphate synthase CbiB [Oscillatoria sp. CS-180]